MKKRYVKPKIEEIEFAKEEAVLVTCYYLVPCPNLCYPADETTPSPLAVNRTPVES